MNILPEILNCKIFVNADEIAKGLNPLNPKSMSIEAGRIMIERINFLLDKRETFALETTLATRSYRKFIEKAKEVGKTLKEMSLAEMDEIWNLAKKIETE